MWNPIATRRRLGDARQEAATWKGEALALQSALVDLVEAVDASLTPASRSKALQEAMTAARYAASLEDPRAETFHTWGVTR